MIPLIKKFIIRAYYELFFLFISALGIFVPKDKNLWLFGVHRSMQWHGNLRALFDKTLEYKNIRTIIFCPTWEIRNKLQALYQNHPESCRIKIICRTNPFSCWPYLRSGVCFSNDIYSRLFKHWGKLLVDPWHGIPLKTIGFAEPISRNFNRNYKFLNDVYHQMDVFIASSDIDRLAMSTCMGHNPHKVWITGLPRNDWLYESHKLADDLKQREQKLLEQLNGKKLVLYAPTWRGWPEVNPLSLEKNFNALLKIIKKHDAILGVRRHPLTKLWDYQKSPHLLECDNINYPEPEILLRNTDIMITDYSSICIDFVLLNKPIIGFCYDYEEYSGKRSFLYDFKKVFPGTITYDMENFLAELDKTLAGDKKTTGKNKEARHNAKDIFFKYDDDKSSQRVIDLVLKAL